MQSSLAAQLAGIRANNNATVLDKSKRKKIHSVSLVYETKEAASQDFESIYYDCLEAFHELETIDHKFSAFADSLFSETSIRFDRMVQTHDQAAALNSAIEQFLMLVSGHLNLDPAFRALEWLVRRFQIQIHNTEALLLSALPYHDSPKQFIRILDVISVHQLPPIFQFLSSCKSSMQGPSRAALVRVCSRDSQLFELINSFELNVISRGLSYNRQLVFWASLNIMLIMANKEEGTFAKAADLVLPSLSAVIVQSEHAQAQIAAYIVLSVLATQIGLSSDVLSAATETLVLNWSQQSRVKGLSCLAQLVEAQDNGSESFSKAFFNALVGSFGSVKGVADELISTVSHNHQITKMVRRLTISVLMHSPAEFPSVVPLIGKFGVSNDILDKVCNFILSERPLDPDLNMSLVSFVELVVNQLSAAQIDKLEVALQASIQRPAEEEFIDADSETTMVEDLPSADPEALTPALKHEIAELAANMEQSSARSFLETPLSPRDPRAQLWSRAAGLGALTLDGLRQLARVSPEAQLSFMLAIAIGPWPTVSRCVAIKVATAMVNTTLSPKLGGKAECADFQAMLPLILFLLSDPERRIRKEAAKLMHSISLSRPVAKKTPRWNETQSNIVWLGENDLGHIISRLLETLEECIMDPEYVFVAARKAGKAVWRGFLASHALNSRMPQVLWVILRVLANFKGVPKQITPLLAEWNRPYNQDLWKQLCKEAKFPLSGIEKALISSLRSNDNAAITFLIEEMQHGDPKSAASLAGDHIVQSWTDVFREDTRERVADALVEICVDEKVQYDAQDVLFRIQPFSANLFMRLLNRAILVNGEQPAAPLFNETPKRRRRRSSSFVQLRGGPRDEIAAEAEKHLRRTTLILEILEKSASQLTDTPRLVSTLFDILEELMALGEGSHLPVLYTEELLANCMISLVESLKSKGAKSRELSTLKVGVVVSCIRSSQSPQVQNRLLLLIASLATLCPDVVLHGVMPIFTFMGANTVRLDNDFSAHVIEQTIEQVIPALVAAGDKHEEIEMALMSFVAAFSHVPRHRRNTLFGALIKTLGPSQSLYKLLLLLGQKYAEIFAFSSGSRSIRSSADAKALIHFTTPFLRSFSAAEQVQAMSSYVRFIVAQTSEEDDSRFGLLKIKEALKQSTTSPRVRNLLFEFLAETAAEPEVIAGTEPLRVQVGARGNALSGDEWQLATSMIDALLQETQASNEHPSSENSAEELLVKCLEMLPIDRFVSVIKPLITSTNERVLSLVSSKFQYESIDDEVALAAAQLIADHLISLVESQPTSPTLDALEPILTKFGPKLRDQELRLLTALVSSNCILSHDIDVVLSSILVINAVCQHLGAAMYGFFPRFFPILCEKVQRAQDQDRLRREGAMDVDTKGHSSVIEEDDEDDDIQLAVFALFNCLLRQMPRFMAPETTTILDLVLASRISVSSRLQVLKVLDDKIDPRTLLTSLTRSLPATLKGGLPAVSLFFTALEIAVEKVSKRELASEISNLTSLLLSCFAVRQSVSDLNFVNQIESKAIECGVTSILRLNDKVFRPQFKRIVRWGFENNIAARQIAMLKFVNRLLSQLKGVVTSYFGFLLDDACDVLEQGNEADPTIRKLVLQALITSFTYDQDDFWQSPARFHRVSEALIGQLLSEPMTHGPLIVKALTALALASSAHNRKRINDSLMQFIASAAPVTQKIWTVKVLSSLYRRLGEDWMANLPQLVPLIAELLDDEEESVELETRKSLVPVIENVLGESLDRYLA